jgi:hypothetical protein
MKNRWLKRTTPLLVKDKVIRLAFKIPGSFDLKHMRPINLYIAVLKIWTTIVARKIYLVWHQNDILYCIQYGYRLDNGTEIPLKYQESGKGSSRQYHHSY